MKMKVAYVFCLMLLCSTLVSAAVVKMHGATTTIDIVVSPNKDVVEKATGITLEVLPNNAGRGLLGLLEGKCDIAVTAADLKTTIETAKKSVSTPLDVNAGALFFTYLKDDEVIFIVNPENSVDSLTDAQIKDIYTGKIKNWKEVGGADLPVMLFSHNTTSATRAFVKSSLFKNEEYDASTKALVNQSMIGANVSINKGAFSALSSVYVNNKVKVLKTSKLVRPLAFITKGAPQGDIKKVIDAFKAEISKK
jgi:phosphate transport system substrate-binding protein